MQTIRPSVRCNRKPALLFVTLIIIFQGWASIRFASASGTEIPDAETRNMARRLNVDQIASLHFYGPNFNASRQTPIALTDKFLIAKFVSALRQATYRGVYLSNRADTMEICFKNVKGVPPIILPLNTRLPKDGYGITFQTLLIDLANYQSKIIKDKVQKIRGQVWSFELLPPNFIGYTTVKDKLNMNVFFEDLQKIDANSFAFTKRSLPLTVRLFSNGMKPIDLHFVLGYEAYRRNSNPSTLPALFRRCFNDTVKN